MRRVASAGGRAGGERCDPVSLETKYLHLRQPVALGHRMDGWRVCWLGGWDKQRVFFVVMLVRVKRERTVIRLARTDGKDEMTGFHVARLQSTPQCVCCDCETGNAYSQCLGDNLEPETYAFGTHQVSDRMAPYIFGDLSG